MYVSGDDVGHLSIILKLMVETGEVNLASLVTDSYTLLMIAASHGDIKLMKAIINRDPTRIDDEDEFGNNVLIIAILSAGDIPNEDEFGSTETIINNRQNKAVRLLLGTDVKVDHVNSDDWTALMEAINVVEISYDTSTVRQLLETGKSNFAYVNYEGESAMSIARSLYASDPYMPNIAQIIGNYRLKLAAKKVGKARILTNRWANPEAVPVGKKRVTKGGKRYIRDII